ncbi:MAG TPA: ATP-binding cassette domain-containing protein [Candidatus Omnitrophota bacterium]|nr:ATP-binding cassette domain-containing protein [Candidatus Omnitrophota bacterium]
MDSPILKLNQVGKRFQVYQVQKTLFRLSQNLFRGKPFKRELWALKNVSFDVLEGDKIAVIGRNGAGKTTLFRIAVGIYSPTEGTIEKRKPLIPLFKYGIGINPHLPVIDNIYIIGAFYGFSVKEIRTKLPEILAFAELEDFPYMPVRNLSSGQAQRLNFSVFMQTDDPFLAFDESLSLADFRFQKKTGQYFRSLMSSNRTVLMASHSLGALRQYCRKAVWLEQGEIVEIGNAEEIISKYEKFCTASLPG